MWMCESWLICYVYDSFIFGCRYCLNNCRPLEVWFIWLGLLSKAGRLWNRKLSWHLPLEWYLFTFLNYSLNNLWSLVVYEAGLPNSFGELLCNWSLINNLLWWKQIRWILFHSHWESHPAIKISCSNLHGFWNLLNSKVLPSFPLILQLPSIYLGHVWSDTVL